jgi:hypothetical protein
MYLVYEGAALLEEWFARRAGRKPRIITISEIVRKWTIHWRIMFVSVCVLWVLFGIWFPIHIIFSCCP